MMRQIIMAAGVFLATAGPSYADADFNIPSSCTSGATGAASSDLATEGDPPIVNIYRFSGRLDSRYATIRSIQSDSSKNWYVTFTVPQDDSYTLYTVYTPFLSAYQSGTYYKGRSYTELLSLPSKGALATLYTSFNIALGDKLANAFINFDQDIDSVDPFTMQVDGSGNLTVYCYMSYSSGQAVTVYDQNHQFVNTGILQSNGTVTWTQSDDLGKD